jgi:hypothetical protein
MEKRIGRVTHYFNRIGVAVLDLSEELKLGDFVRIEGHTSEFIQCVCSMEIDHRKVQVVGPGAEVALKVDEPARAADVVYLVDPQEAVETGARWGIG